MHYFLRFRQCDHGRFAAIRTITPPGRTPAPPQAMMAPTSSAPSLLQPLGARPGGVQLWFHADPSWRCRAAFTMDRRVSFQQTYLPNWPCFGHSHALGLCWYSGLYRTPGRFDRPTRFGECLRRGRAASCPGAFSGAKVSLGRASELCSMPLAAFMKFSAAHGVPPMTYSLDDLEADHQTIERLGL